MDKPQSTRIFQLLRELLSGTQPAENTQELTELIGNMASTNLVERFETKLETKLDALKESQDAYRQSQISQFAALKESQDAYHQSQSKQYSLLLWVISAATGLLVASRFFG